VDLRDGTAAKMFRSSFPRTARGADSRTSSQGPTWKAIDAFERQCNSLLILTRYDGVA